MAEVKSGRDLHSRGTRRGRVGAACIGRIESLLRNGDRLFAQRVERVAGITYRLGGIDEGRRG